METNTAVTPTLDGLRDGIVALRREAIGVAESLGLGLVAAGTVPLVDLDSLPVTPTSRYRRMLDEYQMLAREQLICGAQVHVGIDDRDEAVSVAQRVAPALPVLLALSASSPYWMGEDSGYASVRSLVWLRWPTAGDSGEVTSAEDHDALVADLIASGTITDPKMVYFDVRPSAHLPTVELRVTDACPDVDTVVLLAGLFRGLVLRAEQDYRAGRPLERIRPPLHRAAMWRAARSGLEGDLLDLPRSPVPVPAAVAVERLVGDLRPQLEELGDWEQVFDLSVQALSRGSSAARQRRAMARRGRIADVVDLVVADTRGGATGIGPDGQTVPAGLFPYAATGDEAFPDGEVAPAYAGILNVLSALGSAGLRRREDTRDDEQRSRGITFSVAGEASTRLFPFDLVPRIVPAADWEQLQAGLVQRVRALDAFLGDVYGDRVVVNDGVVPDWVIDGSPELRPSGALVRPARRTRPGGRHRPGPRRRRQLVRAGGQPAGAVRHRVRDAEPPAHRRGAARAPPAGRTCSTSRARRRCSSRRCSTRPARPPATTRRSWCSARARSDSAWFEHRMLAEEMGVPLVRSTDLLVDDGIVHRLVSGKKYRVDVIYLRMDEDSLVHSPGADGMPLGPEPGRRAARGHRRAGQRAGQRHRRRQGGVRVRARADRVLPGREAAAGGRADLPVRHPRAAGRGAGPARRAGLQAGRRVRRRPDRDRPARHAGGPGRGPAADQRRAAPLDRPGDGRPLHPPGLRRPPARAAARRPAGVRLHRAPVGGRAGRR